MKNENPSADQLLEIWGLRISGRSLTSAGLRPGTGGEPGIDEAGVIVRYVEETEGFHRARPALVWVYCEGRAAEQFPLRQPGLSRNASLLRLGWGMHIHSPSPEIAGRVVSEFHACLAERISRDACRF